MLKICGLSEDIKDVKRGFSSEGRRGGSGRKARGRAGRFPVHLRSPRGSSRVFLQRGIGPRSGGQRAVAGGSEFQAVHDPGGRCASVRGAVHPAHAQDQRGGVEPHFHRPQGCVVFPLMSLRATTGPPSPLIWRRSVETDHPDAL